MSRHLILHVGMPKTGTSSIQETLAVALRDPRFRYVRLGLANGSRALQCLVGDQPVAAHVHHAQGIDPEAMRRRAPEFRRAWESQLTRAREAGATPVVSAEDCWFFKHHELRRVREMVEGYGFRAAVLVYLRPPLEWVTSMFQELLKSGHHVFADRLLLPHTGGTGLFEPFGFDYLHRIDALEDVFGCGNIAVRAFRRDALFGGCVVRDFCRQLGIELCPRRIRKVNERLSLDATRFLYAYNRFVRERSAPRFRDVLLLLRRLQECPGGPLRLHPNLLAPVRPLLEAQLVEIRRRFGIDLAEDWCGASDDMVGTERDLMRFAPASVGWLYAATSRVSPQRATVDAQPGDIAVRVSQLRPRLWHRLEDQVRGRVSQLRRIWAGA
jgi:hypothetical protein